MEKMLTYNLDRDERTVVQIGQEKPWGTIQNVSKFYKLTNRPLTTGVRGTSQQPTTLTKINNTKNPLKLIIFFHLICQHHLF